MSQHIHDQPISKEDTQILRECVRFVAEKLDGKPSAYLIIFVETMFLSTIHSLREKYGGTHEQYCSELCDVLKGQLLANEDAFAEFLASGEADYLKPKEEPSAPER